MSLLLLYIYPCVANNSTLKTITPQDFIRQNYSPERETIVNFIVEQFKPFSTRGVSQSELDSIWNDIGTRRGAIMGRFQIVGQKLYAACADAHGLYFFSLLQHFQTLVQKYNIPDVDFIVYMRDELSPSHGFSDKMRGIPAFLMSKDLKNQYESNLLLLPDAFMVDAYWEKLINKIENANTQYPWQSKINTIFWRGSATGGGTTYDMENYDKLPRITLVMLSRSYPDLIDARIVKGSQFDYGNASSIKLATIFSLLFGSDIPYVAEQDHVMYKYLASIDGNTCAWRRVPWIMLSNSVLLKQETSTIEWFYPALKPYVHYVPMNTRLTNIFQQLSWMEGHDTQLQQISKNAQNFVKNNLMPEDIESHTVIILNEYHKLHKEQKIKATLPAYEKCANIVENPNLTTAEKKKKCIKIWGDI
jgi:hypothetical protein